ncbi:aminotransferase class I and II [Ruminiclostridium papyrosolvens DSM 2782]|uniref:Aminotransferase class I and II n=1 Tax=Ruminiclostridium papyrosolvens DSM 2782 TaxID=588581 RepID=F1T7F3_9FIRM|nr:aminotransferase class I/II-fold pyridoxal phosphate-dependent enzyme [Ruminiclostridium papyrosolvens]EGD49401.1 aminotransferase class I and II [Ruminiclostridium papyrosolvens DSM 2782]WES33472.1 aminotransferase class I/II-fold pyridoxal phosphate-dependent enzyme [Ruminiclostridium papyrosolvens DSM 2782]
MELRTEVNFFDNKFLMFVLDQMAYELDKQNPDNKVIRMTLGKSELPLHPDIIKSMQDATGDFSKSSLVFPGGLPELKEKLSSYYKEQYDVDINPNNFIISTGTSAIFRNLFYILSQKGDEVLLPTPYYSLYRFSALLSGADIKYYKIDPCTRRMDMDSFRENFTEKTKIVVINTPGNPLGNVLTDDELYEMDRIVDGKAVIINDEIYSNTYFDEKNKSVMQLKNTKSVFITTNAFSKAYRMYSKRVGYCIVPDELVDPLTVIQHHTLLTVDPVVQYGALTALDYPEEVEKLVELYKDRRNYTVEKFRNNQLVKVINSEGGFYITLECKDFMDKHNYKDSLELAKRIIETKRVATVPGSDFGLPTTLRLSFSTSRYKEGIDLLVDFFNGGAS